MIVSFSTNHYILSRGFASVAQLVEQRTLNPLVLGSSPSGGTQQSGENQRVFPPPIFPDCGRGGRLQPDRSYPPTVIRRVVLC
jgi:hypothetical protein